MRKYEYSDEIVNVINKFLTKDDWNFSFDKETGIFRFGLKIKSKIQNINYVIDVHEDEFITYGICPIGADDEDPEMMAQMAEFICRANYGLKNGCFEFDTDGEIRFKSYVDCEDLLPSMAVIKNSIFCTSTMIKHYAPGIIDIIFGGATARDAYAKCEKQKEEALHSAEEELRSALEEALGEGAGEEDIGELLARLVSKHCTADGDDDSHTDDDKLEDICMDLFMDKRRGTSDGPHVGMDSPAVEGGEA